MQRWLHTMELTTVPGRHHQVGRIGRWDLRRRRASRAKYKRFTAVFSSVCLWYTPTDMEVFRICSLLCSHWSGWYFSRRGWLGPTGVGWGMSTLGFPSPLQSVARRGGVTNISVNFGTQKIFPAYAGWIAPSPWKIAIRTRWSTSNNRWTRRLAIRIREQAVNKISN